VPYKHSIANYKFAANQVWNDKNAVLTEQIIKRETYQF
jgi:hypothetical protein